MSGIVSVVLPVRNAAATIGEQLMALAAQRPAVEWELVVVDNGSTDATRTLVREWMDTLPLRLVDAGETVGGGFARNVGVAAAEGERLVFCDGDDIVWPGWIDAHARALDEHDLVAGAIDHRRFTPALVSGAISISMRTPPGRSEWMVYADTSNAAVRRAAFEAIGGFDEHLSRGYDKDLSWRLQLGGHRLHFAPDAVISKRPRSSYARAFRQHFGYGRHNLELYRKFRSAGMPRDDLRYVALQYWWLATGWSRLPPGHRRYWYEVAGMRAGRALGSARWLTLYP